MRQVRVEDYQPEWVEAFEREARSLREVFGDLLVDIYHIGSTSVPGLAAKPIIDMLPVVWNIAAVDALNNDFRALGYEPRGELGLPGRRYFSKGKTARNWLHRTHHVHTYALDSAAEIRRHLAVRDYLRLHAGAAEAYGSLKKRLAEQHLEDINAYMDGKDKFVKQLERAALSWLQTRQTQFATWYHGSPAALSSLRPASTITPFRSLARVFSHRPTQVSATDLGDIKHNGTRPGYLYTIGEALRETDLYPHPNSTMPDDWEWITTRPLAVRLVKMTEPRVEEQLEPPPKRK